MGRIADIGSLSRDSWDGLVMLNSSGSADQYTSFQYPVGTYHQVESGKVLRCGLIIYSVGKISTSIAVGYGDDSVLNSAVAPTNYVELMNGLLCEVVNRCSCEPVYLEIPSGKYPVAFFFDNSGRIRLYGFEEV